MPRQDSKRNRTPGEGTTAVRLADQFGVARRPDGSSPFRAPNPGNKTCGIWGSAFVEERDREIFASLRSRLAADYPHMSTVDEIELDLLTIHLIRLGRLYEGDNWLTRVDVANQLDLMAMRHMKELRGTRAAKAKATADKKDRGAASPAEFASRLLKGETLGDLERRPVAGEGDADGEAEWPDVGGSVALGAATDDDPESSPDPAVSPPQGGTEGGDGPLTQAQIREVRDRVRRETQKNAGKTSHNTSPRLPKIPKPTDLF